MNDDFPEIWQSQTTTGSTMSMEEFRRRLERSKERARRKHYAVPAILVLGTVSSIAAAFFFNSYRDVVVWGVAVEFLTWVVFCWFLPKDWLELRSQSPHADPFIIRLDLNETAQSGLDFYRQELQGHYDTVRYGRGVALASAIGGLLLVILGLVFPNLTLFSTVFLTVGFVLAVGGTWRYVVLRHEYPNARAEFEDLETLGPAKKG